MSLNNTAENIQETSLNKVEQFSNASTFNQLEGEVQKNLATQATKQEKAKLTSKVETMQYEKNELISLAYLKDTPLKETMLSVLAHQDFDQVAELQNKSPEQRVELIFRKINIGLTRFYARKFNLTPEQGVPSYLEKVILPATEWFLMDLLGKTGQKMNVNFLASLSEMSFEKVGQIFQDIKTFSDSFMLPFAQAKALLNLSDFLALPKNRQELEKLDSPYDFYEKVMKNPVWTKEPVSEPVKAEDQDKKVNIHELKRGDFGLTPSSELSEAEQQQRLKTEKEKIKQEI